MTFRRFLRSQRRRNDPVGDLARDFLDDHNADHVRTVRQMYRYLRGLNACDGALDACLEAWHDWVWPRHQALPPGRQRDEAVLRVCRAIERLKETP